MVSPQPNPRPLQGLPGSHSHEYAGKGADPVSEYTAAFVAGVRPSAPIEGIFGRVLRGTQPDHFTRLTSDLDRRLALVTGHDALNHFIGRSGAEILNTIGYSSADTAFFLAAGAQFRLCVCAEAGALPSIEATWHNVLQAAERAYPELKGRLVQHSDELRARPFVEFDRQAGGIIAAHKRGPSDPGFMSVPNFLASDQSAAAVRAFLYHTLGLRELFAGDGRTRLGDGRKGVSERLVSNVPLLDLGMHALIDLQVS
ncbi:MAG: hypothetical protein K1X79_06655 [Oligoflexia bacterium]|nr:hypothetical protein [Oligoflexia bacterium]